MKKVLILLGLCVCVTLAQDMVVRVYVHSWQDLKRISPKHVLDIAGGYAGEYYDIVADQNILNRIIASGLTYEVRVHSLEYEKDKARAAYLSYTEVNDSLRQLVQNYPSICKLDSLPIQTYEGRWAYGIKISDNVQIEEDDEPGFLIDGTHHAREWACPIVVMFFADSFLSAYGSVPEITNIINTTEIYCFPIVNVDGYVYDYPSGRMWRKNREPFGGGIGNDPNRNYQGCAGDIEGDWGAVDNGKATHNNTNPQARGLFCGPYQNSGDEIRGLIEYVKSRYINAYMSYHMHGELMMWGWGWTTQGTPDNALHIQVGTHMASLIQRLGGGTYRPGQIPIILYPVSGSSLDWLYSWSHYVGGISNLSFTTEMGTDFYQNPANLDHIIHQNFKALKYLAGFCDSIVLLVEGAVPAPTIYPLGTVGEDFTISWHAKNTVYNNPTQWELVELSNPSIIEDNLESGTGRWNLDGFTLSTAQSHSATHSFYSGSQNNMNSAVTTKHPYLVQPGDSVTFWCRYNLETDWDVAVGEVSENTREWYNLDTNRFTGNSGGWTRKVFSLSNWAGKSIYLRFRAMTDANTLGTGFYVDDIYPVCLFGNVNVISSSIPDTFYQFNNHPEGEFYYYVKGYNTTWDWGDYSCLEKAEVVVGLVEEKPESAPILPVFTIQPNIFSKQTHISLSFGKGNEPTFARLKIYNASGRLVKSFDMLSDCSIAWHGDDNFGNSLPGGVYFAHFETSDSKKIEKIILVR